MSNQASPGDTNNALIRKILTAIAASVSGAVLSANQPRPGDTDNKLLQKILTLLASGSAALAEGGAAPVLAAEGAPPATVVGVDGDVYIDLENGDVYIYEGDTNTWVLQSSTIGNTFSTEYGTPAESLGKEGDVYVDANTGIVWVKGAGGWADSGVAFEMRFSHSVLPYTSPAVIDFGTEDYQTVSLTGDIIFTTAGREAGKAVTMRIISDGTPRNLTFPGDWVWVGSAAPTSLAANKTAVLSVTCFGSTDADIVAAYAAET